MIKFIVSLDNDGAVKEIKNLEKQSDSLSKKFSSAGKVLTLGLTTPLTALATAGIKYNASLETYTANLTTLLNGNQKAASQLLSDLKEMANTTPFETTSLVKATQTMLGFGIELQDSQKYLKQLGDISMGDAQKLDGLTLAFSQVQSAGKLSGQDLLQMINQGFNPLNVISQKTGESMASLKERMGEGALSANEIAQALEWATEEGGLFYGAMDKASQTTEGKLSTLKDEFNSAIGEMTTSLLPVFTSFVDKLTDAARWFGKLTPEQKEFIVKIGAIVAAIGPALLIISKMISTFEKGINTIKKVSKGFQLLFSVISANPIILIVGAITAVIAGLVLLYNKCEWFRNAINSIFGFIIGIVQGIIDFFKNNWQTILLFMLNPFAGVFKILYDKFEWFRNIVNYVVEFVKNLFLGMFNFISSIVTNIYNFWQNVFLLIVAVVSTVIETIVGIIGSIVNWIYLNVLMPIYNFFYTIFASIYNVIANFITNFMNGIGIIANWIYSNVLQPIYNFFSSIWNSIWDIISNVINSIKNGFSSAASFIKNTFNKVKSFISNIFSTVAGIIKTPINGVISAINTVLKAMNKIKVPDWVPGIGGKGIHFSMIPKLSQGTNYVRHEGLAYLHQGEAVVPKKYNPAVNGNANSNSIVYVNVEANMDVDKFGQAFVKDIKVFSGGSKNSYNYGGGN